MELEDFKNEFRDIVYDALQRHAEVLKRSYGWGVFASIMNSVAKDVEQSLRSMGREASCNAGLVISNPRLAHGTESYGKAFISCTIKRPGEKEKMVTAYIPMSAVITVKDERATVTVFGIGEKEDIEVK